MTVQYRIAEHPYEYRMAHDLVKKMGQPARKMTFPTIVATEKGPDPRREKCVGVTARMPSKKFVAVGTWLSPRRFVSLRIIEAWENSLINLGMVEYYIPVDAGDLKVQSLVESAFGIKPFQRGPKTIWYKRRLNGKPRR